MPQHLNEFFAFAADFEGVLPSLSLMVGSAPWSRRTLAASAQSAQAASSLQLLAALQRKQCNSAGSGGGIAFYVFRVRIRAMLKQKLYNIDIIAPGCRFM